MAISHIIVAFASFEVHTPSVTPALESVSAARVLSRQNIVTVAPSASWTVVSCMKHTHGEFSFSCASSAGRSNPSCDLGNVDPWQPEVPRHTTFKRFGLIYELKHEVLRSWEHTLLWATLGQGCC